MVIRDPASQPGLLGRNLGSLLVDLDELPAAERNLLWLAFTNAQWRAGMIDSDPSRCRLVASFRSAMANHLGEPAWQDLLSRLCNAPEDLPSAGSGTTSLRSVSRSR